MQPSSVSFFDSPPGCDAHVYCMVNSFTRASRARFLSCVVMQGGNCQGGYFVERTANSTWKRNAAGKFRVQECPTGFALTVIPHSAFDVTVCFAGTFMLPCITNSWLVFVCDTQRDDNNELGDACVWCPQGSYNLDGSVWNPSHEMLTTNPGVDGPQSGTQSPPHGFCLKCPVGASCTGGNGVYAKEGRYTYNLGIRFGGFLQRRVHISVTYYNIRAYAAGRAVGGC
jgi:hypothetical protein